MGYVAKPRALRLVLPPQFVLECRLALFQIEWAERLGLALSLMVSKLVSPCVGSKITVCGCGGVNNAGGRYICSLLPPDCWLVCPVAPLATVVRMYGPPVLVTVMVHMPVVTVSTPIVAVSTPIEAGTAWRHLCAV
ncbi:uncharacterized protein G2W53_018261 [Senna tora]|uniref:Uncharacterized protein n=1 Tax=Senna tora TaxID=362788 RepID=A0A834TTB2_9FABA|nr:uncharacterized protein G2W53_018261 [Senna tora]